jgi:hypothetical protein
MPVLHRDLHVPRCTEAKKTASQTRPCSVQFFCKLQANSVFMLEKRAEFGQRFAFRCLFIYFWFMVVDGWLSFLSEIPGVWVLYEWFQQAFGAVVNGLNRLVLHVKPVLNPNGMGSGDTSFAWAAFYSVLILSVLGGAVWTIIDRRRQQPYTTLWQLMVHSVRYFVALVSLSYGIIKVFHGQMPFPNASQLATPLGDFLPMRLMWMFMGYSGLYQAFAGWVEVLVGLLLLWRPTLVLGAMVGVGVYANVFVLNLAYDVPVKLNAAQLLFACLFLVATDGRRLLRLFVHNLPTTPSMQYHWPLTKRWQRVGRWVAKVLVLAIGLLLPGAILLFEGGAAPTASANAPAPGYYETLLFVKNGDTLPVLARDSTVWKDLVLEPSGAGSVGSTDTTLRQRYRRGYFDYKTDTATQALAFYRNASDSLPTGTLRYAMGPGRTLALWGKLGADSLFVRLQTSWRHYQLTERQFHWLSERNR